MSRELSERVEELQLLGWSADGAQNYAENFVDRTSLFEIPRDSGLIIFSALLLLIIVSFLLLYKLFNKDIFRRSFPKEKINISKEENLSEANIDRSLIILNGNKDIIKKEDQNKDLVTRRLSLEELLIVIRETSVDTGKIIEHFLLFIVVFYEILDTLIKSNKVTNTSIKTIKANNSIDKSINEKRERYLELSKKSNIELRSFLAGRSNISRLNKSQLIDTILKLENTDPT